MNACVFRVDNYVLMEHPPKQGLKLIFATWKLGF